MDFDRSPPYDVFNCHLCHSPKEMCNKMTVMIHQLLENTSNYLPSGSGKLESEAEHQIKQLELIHDLHPKLLEDTENFRQKFKEWSECRQETIEQLYKCVGQVVNMKTCTNVVKAGGQVTGIIGKIIAIGGVLLAPETGGLSLIALGIRVSIASKLLKAGAKMVDGLFGNFQSKQVASLIKKDRKLTEEIANYIDSMMTTSELFSQAVDEFERRNQIFGFQEVTKEVKLLKSDNNKAKKELDVVKNAMKTGLPIGEYGLTTGFLVGAYALYECLELIQTVKDLTEGSKSQLQENILALTAVMTREHDILNEQYNSLSIKTL